MYNIRFNLDRNDNERIGLNARLSGIVYRVKCYRLLMMVFDTVERDLLEN